ncbi:MAG: diaminopimelate decarboxylase, partial [Acidobacteriaceae bacterium]
MTELLEWHDGKAAMQGITIEQLAAEYGTPLYVYDERILVDQFERLRRALPQAVEIYYSIKANPHPKVIGVFVRCGAGCEIASGGEYALARRAGALPERIVFAGPGKGREELEYVIEQGIGEIHIESFEEIDILEEIAERLDKTLSISVRMNPSGAFGGGLLMGGQPTAFGFEEESLDQVLDVVSHHPHLNLRGVHLYTGTQILDAETLLRHWQHAIELAKKTADFVGQPISTVDLGGGLGIPYFAHETELDLEVLREGAKTLIDLARADPRLKQARFVVEPGRFLAGPAGLYVASVRSVKICRGTT